jgi:hypothetical protein
MTEATLERGERESVEQELEAELDVAFAPLHKLCFGIAIGCVCAILVLASTWIHMLRSPDRDVPLILLAQYFRGYDVHMVGSLIGALWAFWVGFVLGWFFAFCRNFVLAAAAIFFRARAELAQNRGFLDHI